MTRLGDRAQEDFNRALAFRGRYTGPIRPRAEPEKARGDEVVR